MAKLRSLAALFDGAIGLVRQLGRRLFRESVAATQTATESSPQPDPQPQPQTNTYRSTGRAEEPGSTERFDLRIPWGAITHPSVPREPTPVERPLRIAFIGDYIGRPERRAIEDRSLIPALSNTIASARTRLAPEETPEVRRRWSEVEWAASIIGDAPGMELFILNASRDDLIESFADAPWPNKSDLYRIFYMGEFWSSRSRPFGAAMLASDIVRDDRDTIRMLGNLCHVAERAQLPFWLPLDDVPLPAGISPLLGLWLRHERLIDAITGMKESFTRHGLLSMDDPTLVDVQIARTLKLVALNQFWGRDAGELARILDEWLAERTGEQRGALFADARLEIGEVMDYQIAFQLSYVPRPPLPWGRRVVSGWVERD